MLKSLYDYAVRNRLILPPGYVNKTVKAYIVLSSKNVDFADIILSDGKEIPAPDIGSLANGTDKSNVLLEKRSIVFPAESTAKSDFFLNALKDAAKEEPLLIPCIQAIENPEHSERIRQLLDREKINPGERISFHVDYENSLASDASKSWWAEYRNQFTDVKKEKLERCLITGELTTPLRTAGVVTGLHAVGGHARGDAVICFDKAAFESYDLKQAANAPVSEEAMSAVNIALTALLNLFYTGGTPVREGWAITWEGIDRAVKMILRITLLITGTFLLTYTTSPMALTDGLESLLKPLKKVKVPVHELTLMMSMALRFIPTLIEETDKIMSAQRARGADFETGNLIQRAKALLPILVPLFVSAFRRADELAVAMESRCYHGGEGRTRMKQLHYARIDFLTLILGAGFLTAVLLLKHYGW